MVLKVVMALNLRHEGGDCFGVRADNSQTDENALQIPSEHIHHVTAHVITSDQTHISP